MFFQCDQFHRSSSHWMRICSPVCKEVLDSSLSFPWRSSWGRSLDQHRGWWWVDGWVCSSFSPTPTLCRSAWNIIFFLSLSSNRVTTLRFCILPSSVQVSASDDSSPCVDLLRRLQAYETWRPLPSRNSVLYVINLPDLLYVVDVNIVSVQNISLNIDKNLPYEWTILGINMIFYKEI